MIYNFWTIALGFLILCIVLYCGKKEFYTEPTPDDKGMKYTLNDVNNAYQAILNYFDHSITIPKVISIKRVTSTMTLEIFVYHIQTNIMKRYTVTVNIPLSSKGEYTIDQITEFSISNTISPNETTSYQKVDFYLK